MKIILNERNTLPENVTIDHFDKYMVLCGSKHLGIVIFTHLDGCNYYVHTELEDNSYYAKYDFDIRFGMPYGSVGIINAEKKSR